MTIGIWYSNSPYGTGDLKDAANITISSGVATLSEEQTGNIGAGCCIEFTADETEYCVYIAPNRIGFDGGATEIKPGYKIEDNTSGATGIVRYVEVTSGTWGGTPAAAGYIYFEETSGTFGNNNTINIIKPTVSNSVATVDGTIQGNIGNGNTQFVVKKPDGSGDAADQTSVAVTSIHHVWASLSDAEGASGFTSANFLDETSLVTAGVVAFLTCYYDHDGSPGDADTNAVTIDFGTTGEDNYLQIYTPVGNAESINSQRHEGAESTSKHLFSGISVTNHEAVILINEGYTVTEGLQITNWDGSAEWGFTSGIQVANVPRVIIRNNLIYDPATTNYKYKRAIYDPTTTSNYGASIYNNLVYDIVSDNRCYGINSNDNDTDKKCFYNTVYNVSAPSVFGRGFSVGYTTIKNNVSTDTSETDFTFGSDVTNDYNASEDSTATGANSVTGATAANNYTNVASRDFTVKDTDAPIYQAGTPLHATDGIWRDIIGTERDTTSPDIGAFEYVASGGTDNIKSVSGITWANVKSIGGVAKADIKKVGDLDTTS
jgi:hypothetical protein